MKRDPFDGRSKRLYDADPAYREALGRCQDAARLASQVSPHYNPFTPAALAFQQEAAAMLAEVRRLAAKVGGVAAPKPSRVE